MAEREERGLFIRSVAPVAEWLRWDGKWGHWGGWGWGSPQRDRDRWGQERRSSEGHAHRTVPAGWCHHAPSMAQIAPLVQVQEEGKGEAGVGIGPRDVEGVGVGKTFLGQVSLRLEDVRGDSEGEAGSACFGQVSRRLGRLLKRLPKSRSWSDSLRILRRSSSNGSLLPTSGMKRRVHASSNDWKMTLKKLHSKADQLCGDEKTDRYFGANDESALSPLVRVSTVGRLWAKIFGYCVHQSIFELQCPPALLLFVYNPSLYLLIYPACLCVTAHRVDVCKIMCLQRGQRLRVQMNHRTVQLKGHMAAVQCTVQSCSRKSLYFISSKTESTHFQSVEKNSM